MAIYGRTGDRVTMVRRAVLADVKRLENRKPDKQDRDGLKNDALVIVKSFGKERLYHLAFLRADGGLNEIADAIEEAEAPRASDACAAHPEDGQHERNRTEPNLCVYCGKRLKKDPEPLKISEEQKKNLLALNAKLSRAFFGR